MFTASTTSVLNWDKSVRTVLVDPVVTSSLPYILLKSAAICSESPLYTNRDSDRDVIKTMSPKTKTKTASLLM